MTKWKDYIGAAILLSAMVAYFTFTREKFKHVKVFPSRIGAFKQEKFDDLYNIKISSFSLISKVPGNKRVICHYVRPYDAKGNLAPRADTVVYYAHYPMERNYYKIPKGKQRSRIFIDLARKSGFTVFSVDFANSPIGAGVSNPKVFYYYPDSGSFDTVLEAYEKMREKENMTFSKIFMTGLSGGSSMAVNFINTYPDMVDALALFVGWRYLTPPHSNNAVWLIQYTLGSHTTKNNNVLAESLRDLGKYPIVAETMPNWTMRGQKLFNHCENWNAKNMMYMFLEDVADLRKENNGVMPPETAWPYVISMSDKLLLMKNLGNKSPVEDPLYMPSKRFYEEYMKIVPKPAIIKISDKNNVIIGYPAPERKDVDGVVLNLNTKHGKDVKSMDYDARYFAENGFWYLAASNPTNIDVLKKILFEKLKVATEKLPVVVIADNLQPEKLDLHSSDCSKIIIFCRDEKYFDKIKFQVINMIDERIAVKLIVPTKKLKDEIGKKLQIDSDSLIDVIYFTPGVGISSERLKRDYNNLILSLLKQHKASKNQTDNTKTTLSPK